MNFKMILTAFGILILVLLITAGLVLNLSPQFGKSPSASQKKSFEKLDNYQDGKFQNQIKTEMDIHLGKMIKGMFGPADNRSPVKTIETHKIDSLSLVDSKPKKARLTWFGHSAFLLEMAGQIILIDPMLGETAAPFSWAGPKRYSKELPIALHKLPAIDAIIISHDHYDHLDYESILALKDKTSRFYTTLGVGNHLIKWGVDPGKIVELNWWEESSFNNIRLICTPARHFSGRGVLDRNRTLWGSWIIQTDSTNIYFSGDGGYGPHFKEIGTRYGPFDISLMECGQYNEQWHAIHMMPEETAQAAVDVNSKLFIPIHWGAFTLAFHEWTDPIQRAIKEAKRLEINISTPAIGESFEINNSTFPNHTWWEQYEEPR